MIRGSFGCWKSGGAANWERCAGKWRRAKGWELSSTEGRNKYSWERGGLCTGKWRRGGRRRQEYFSREWWTRRRGTEDGLFTSRWTREWIDLKVDYSLLLILYCWRQRMMIPTYFLGYVRQQQGGNLWTHCWDLFHFQWKHLHHSWSWRGGETWCPGDISYKIWWKRITSYAPGTCTCHRHSVCGAEEKVGGKLFSLSL